MKQLTIITIIAGLLAIVLCACEAKTEEHSGYLMNATVIEAVDGKVVVEREDGHIFEHKMHGDLPTVGKTVCCWYDTKDTKQVEDDFLISMSYSD